MSVWILKIVSLSSILEFVFKRQLIYDLIERACAPLRR